MWLPFRPPSVGRLTKIVILFLIVAYKKCVPKSVLKAIKKAKKNEKKKSSRRNQWGLQNTHKKSAEKFKSIAANIIICRTAKQ